MSEYGRYWEEHRELREKLKRAMENKCPDCGNEHAIKYLQAELKALEKIMEKAKDE